MATIWVEGIIITGGETLRIMLKDGRVVDRWYALDIFPGSEEVERHMETCGLRKGDPVGFYEEVSS